jgi:hypothetical protein
MKGSKPIKRESLRRMIAGIQASKTKSVVLEGTQHKLSDVSSMCQASIDAGVDADAKQVVWREAVALSRGKDAALNPILLAFIGHLLVASTPSELEEYGLKPRSRAKTTPQTKVDAAEKAAATRTARNTMGKRQKAKVVGVVPTEDDDETDANAAVATPAAGAAAASAASKTTPQSN